MSVSIVVPIYNTEAYLKRCIGSIINQSYLDIEVLLVDDGSTDSSGIICDDYAAVDGRVRVIHKANGGEASARNAGLIQATGQYIMFCDSDDALPLYAIERFMKAMDESAADMAVGAYIEKTNDPSSRDFATRYCLAHYETYTNTQAIISILSGKEGPGQISHALSAVNGSLFKRSIIFDNHILFDEKFVIGNDTLFVADYLRFANKIHNVFSIQYIYYQYGAERVQGMSWVYPDSLKLYVTMFEKFWSVITTGQDISESIRKDLLFKLFDNIIAEMVKAVAYEEYFAEGFLPELTKLVNTPLVYEASQVYSPTRLSDSRIIPVLFRLKQLRLLLLILRKRAKKYIKKCGKSSHVRLMVHEQ
ncbi:Glycosyl transferase [uncultured Sporomusa sp.]|uniref:Glycosyl transferase n=1 Tax=uncultured Sporomusa sp. TaxID=307249 RepID=A0A212M1Y3_9FIRM|nr:glycosyltransferase family 2 protein [uncultured Sporomusa sp.]SCM83669.1 Glycosyl transferase [uncultured Sporomusa sp.]